MFWNTISKAAVQIYKWFILLWHRNPVGRYSAKSSEKYQNSPIKYSIKSMCIFNTCTYNGNFSIHIWRQYVSLFASIAAIVSLLLISDRIVWVPAEIIEAFKLVIILSLCEKTSKFTGHPSLKWLKFSQYKHDPKVKTVRVNGQITEVKQQRPRLILRWVTIWNPCILFLSVVTSRKLIKFAGISKNLNYNTT